jgi:O-antigen/teichoic acid export membrane protein
MKSEKEIRGWNATVLDSRPVKQAETPSGITTKVSKNVALSLARVAINSLVALVLPAYLTHRLPVATYGAWVLVLQLGAFVSYLDFGVQTGVSKFVAEHDARGDVDKAGRYASVGLAIMTLTGLLGILCSFALAWEVPRLFQSMPAYLYRDVRISVILVGCSLSFGLVCSVFSAVFLGLQQYTVPMGIAILNRSSYTLVILIAVFFHGSLASMGACVAVVNVTTGFLQAAAWRKLAGHIRISLRAIDLTVLREMISYCFLLAIWTIGLLCVSGLDLTIVGHYAFNQTAYYSTATLPTNFMLLIISSMLGPMMPASSALSTQRSASEMGHLLARFTRYSTMLLLLTGLPLLVYGFWILRIWVGPSYSIQSVGYLRILVVANILRMLCGPYSTIIAATGRLAAATCSPVLEAVVNITSSLYLARHFGAEGVAYGTLLGAFVSVTVHFAVSMHYTRQTLTISRTRLWLTGVLRPATMAIPSVTLVPLLWSHPQRSLSPGVAIIWGISTLLFAWFVSFNQKERAMLKDLVKCKLTVSPR